MKKGLLRFLCALLAIGAAECAQGASLSYTATIGTENNSFSEQFTLPEFNTHLGTLNDIQIRLHSSITPEIEVLNLNSGTRSFTKASATIPLMITGPDGTSIMTTATEKLSSGTVGANTSVLFPGATKSANTTVLLATTSFGSYESAGSSMALFTASSPDGTYSGTSSSGVFFSGGGSVGGTVTITYDYTAACVPEPASLCMAGAAVVLIFGATRLHRRSGADCGR